MGGEDGHSRRCSAHSPSVSPPRPRIRLSAPPLDIPAFRSSIRRTVIERFVAPGRQDEAPSPPNPTQRYTMGRLAPTISHPLKKYAGIRRNPGDQPPRRRDLHLMSPDGKSEARAQTQQFPAMGVGGALPCAPPPSSQPAGPRARGRRRRDQCGWVRRAAQEGEAAAAGAVA
jgi:hypothetical protein